MEISKAAEISDWRTVVDWLQEQLNKKLKNPPEDVQVKTAAEGNTVTITASKGGEKILPVKRPKPGVVEK